ncbi:uncharacterized protein L203_104796 [Cryptococcus depauperatus CBS 7841]|uniref:Protein-lysine N-methyltransferase EFM6 n=1 Tax=Cryptococcus depauperatus CBS 7841 TaxID=1295531 RepID=A0A1E3ING6_9TREE|nr:hypothetical protein L203_01998 [Cryptococcus depauperatus CBS 7841]
MSDAPEQARSRSSSISTVSSALPTFEALVPPRIGLTSEEKETRIDVPGLKDIKLKIDAGPGCGGIAWPSGEVLSRYLAYRHAIDPTRLYGQKVIELGSGTGLVGIVAAMLEPTAEIWVTDQAQLLELMTTNAELNLKGKNQRNVHVAELNWGEPLPSNIPTEEASLILAADCVYFEPTFPLLVKTLCDLAPVGKPMEILFCYKKRRKADKRFFIMLKKHFTLTPVDDDKDSERYQREGVTLMKLKRRK